MSEPSSLLTLVGRMKVRALAQLRGHERRGADRDGAPGAPAAYASGHGGAQRTVAADIRPGDGTRVCIDGSCHDTWTVVLQYPMPEASVSSLEMGDSNEVLFPPDQRDPRWYVDSPVVVRWDARRDPEVAVVSAIGTIMVARDELPEDYDESDEDAHYEKAGEIHIAKPFLGDANAVMAMDALTSDHEYLATAVLDGTDYDEGFHDWFEAEFDLNASGTDPIFVLDLKMNEGHRDPDALVAAHAALDALVTFGSASSPLVTFDIEQTDPEIRPGLRDEASWTWVHALRAKRWKHVYVAVRPFATT